MSPKGRDKPKRPLSSPESPESWNIKRGKTGLDADSSDDCRYSSSEEDHEISKIHKKIVGKRGPKVYLTKTDFLKDC